MSETYTATYNIEADSFETAGEVSRSIKATVSKLGLDPALVRKIAVCSYEAEINIIIHSLGGEIILEISNSEIVVRAKDRGPGIEIIELAMTEGWSTADEEARQMGFGAGMGLSNMKNNSDIFSIKSDKSSTDISMKFLLR